MAKVGVAPALICTVTLGPMAERQGPAAGVLVPAKVNATSVGEKSASA